MSRFRITIEIECDTLEQAETVANERLGYDEEYDDPATGAPFEYKILVHDVEQIDEPEPAEPWAPTHRSKSDGSTVRLVSYDEELRLPIAENENGDRWVINPLQWEEL